MDTKLSFNKVLFNKLNEYFKDNIKMSLKDGWTLIIITKDDLFYCIDIENESISSFIINDDNQVIHNMIVNDLCHKQINDIYIDYSIKPMMMKIKNYYYCFARNEYKIYFYDFFNRVMKEYISQQLIIDMCCGKKHSILLTQSGKVYEYKWNEDDLKKSEIYIDFKLKSFNNCSFQSEKIKMISCGALHSLALTESGLVFSWGDNDDGQLGVNVEHSCEPIIIELNDLKIQKISCGPHHNLLLSCDGHIYAFGMNLYGEVGNGILQNQRFPIKLELNNKFIDIASDTSISMSQSIDGIYYVWGFFEDKWLLSPQSTTYQSFEHILRANSMGYKTFDKLVEFEDSFVKNGFYSKHFEEKEALGSGSFGSVFKVKRKEDIDNYRRSGNFSAMFNYYYENLKQMGNDILNNFKDFQDYGSLINRMFTQLANFHHIKNSAIKKIKFTSVDTNEMREYRIKEFLNYKKITRDCSDNENLVQNFDAWFEEEIVSSQSRICLYIQMELCDKTLDDVIKELKDDPKLKASEVLTIIGYYIASQIFIQALQGVNYLHTRKPPIIHRDLNPRNILLKKDSSIGFCVKIADFGLIAIHQCLGQSHSNDMGTIDYTAPEVREGNKYDTKADIYSLGVILKNLFSLNMNESYDENQSLSQLLKIKYKEAIDLHENMLKPRRPSCEEILNKTDLWALNKKEFQVSGELKKIIKSKQNENESTIYSMLISEIDSSSDSSFDSDISLD